MVDYREEFLNYLNSSARAIKGLEDVYNKALGQVSYNNLASKMILSVVNDYLDVLTSKFQTLVSIDKKGGSMTDYSDAFLDLGISAKAEFFNKFTKFYLDRLLEEIYDFYFDSALREKFETANDFYALYSQQDTKSIIESMQTVESQNKITKTFEGITDENGTFSKICEFLKGEM